VEIGYRGWIWGDQRHPSSRRSDAQDILIYSNTIESLS
jgi:hypothetical protein